MAQTSSKKRKILFFTDFDGTITTEDSNDAMVSALGFGPALLAQFNLAVLEGHTPLREAFTSQLHSIPLPLSTCLSWTLSHTSLDPLFAPFVTWAAQHEIPVTVLSGGLKTFISAILERDFGSDVGKGMRVFGNDVVYDDGEGRGEEGRKRDWRVKFWNGSASGMDKGAVIRRVVEEWGGQRKGEGGERPVVVFVGDGVSDVEAVREADVVFAKSGRDLVLYCEREGVKYRPFADWGDVLRDMKEIWEIVEAGRELDGWIGSR